MEMRDVSMRQKLDQIAENSNNLTMGLKHSDKTPAPDGGFQLVH